MKGGRVRRAQVCALLSVVAVFALVSASEAKPEGGSWKGSAHTHKGSSNFKGLKFKVVNHGRKLKGFNVHVSSYCAATGVTPYVIYVPSAKIKSSGSVHRVYRQRSVDLKVTLNGHVGHDSAHGTVKSHFTGCGGKFDWKAKPKG